MAKRKRNNNGESAAVSTVTTSKKLKSTAPKSTQIPTTIQIVAGSYDRVLHGITATISPNDKVDFADTFLFNAHDSAIRCLALSPPSAPVPKQTQKVILASGSSDERINLYHLSAHTPSHIAAPAVGTLKASVQNSQNKVLGSLSQHRSSVTALYFPTRSKLMSSAEDNTIAVTRTRDWSLLCEIKAPVPKPVGRPSGDTAPLGGAPSGVNDFAVHPSMKLMISVGKGEKCMRLWNLVTGKKAGVLTFEREMLGQVGEGKFSSGEGRKVAWGATDAGEEFCVGFDKGALIFGMDSKPKCKVVPQPRDKKHQSKIHQLCYVQVDEKKDIQVLALSTEDGRILFYSTRPEDLTTLPAEQGKEAPLPSAKLIAIVDSKDGDEGKDAKTDERVPRIKDFTIMAVGEGGKKTLYIIAGRSAGGVKVFRLPASDLTKTSDQAQQVGKLLGTYETGNRITCVESFVMLPQFEGDDELELEDFEGFEEADDVEEDNSSSSDSE
ncbi:Protein MAK11 [Lachnellula willkommii]|uniref:Protein MAK11 n=1 Tax=Lachnellula willkommii TaxID=215461 RepID=A0A559MDQ6_9HELO|nr:Protein MAK11 [Lachnellula willkommii]